MQKIAILTDTCSGLPASLAEENGIHLLPLIIRVGEVDHRADVDIFPEDVYRILPTEIPKTSLPSAEQAGALLTSLAEQGYTHAIAIMLSSGLSGTYNLLRLMEGQIPGLELRVWDSLSGSLGCGITALNAARAVREGGSFDEINAAIPGWLENSHVFFSVDTLEYLQKGGRIGKVTALAGTALQIKPILSFTSDGQLSSVAKVRGRRLVQTKLCELVGQYITPGCRYVLLVADGGDPEGGAQLREALLRQFPDCEGCVTAKIDSTLSCYIGPGVLGAGVQILP